MFQYKEVLHALKQLASTNSTPAHSHCKLLEFYTKQLGYESYHHFCNSLNRLPIDKFEKISLKLMKKICLGRNPSQKSIYYEFQVFSKNKVGHYSYWVGWDKYGEEVRIPRPMQHEGAIFTTKKLREVAPFPIYVVETSNELLAWRYFWGGTAIIPEKIAKEAFPLAFQKHLLVEKNPPMDLVKANANKYQSNIADID